MSLQASLVAIEDGTYMFNSLAGNLSKEITKEVLLNQVKLIEEELQETKKAIEEANDIETLDGVIDVCVVLFGLMQMMDEQNKYAFLKAAIKVSDNNASKFPDDKTIAEATQLMYKTKGISTEIEYRKDYGQYVIKNAETGKVLKPVGFKPVDLSDCVVVELP